MGNTTFKKKKLDTVEDRHNKHTIEDQGCSWATPSQKCLGVVFSRCFDKMSYLARNEAFCEIEKNGAKQVR